MRRKHPIEALIEQGEHQQLDFKFEVSDSKKIARTLSAFANTDGGRLLIGVKDNGHKLYTRPEVPFEATRWEINGKTVLEIYVAPCPDRPYMAPDKDDRFKAYIRVADENILANKVLVLAWQKRHQTDGTLLKISQPVERLLAYLDNHAYITLRQFCRIGKIKHSPIMITATGPRRVAHFQNAGLLPGCLSQ